MKYAIPRDENTGWGVLGTNLERALNGLEDIPNSIVLHAINGASYEQHVPFLRGSRVNAAIMFFEDVQEARNNAHKAKDFDIIFYGSSWNARVARGFGLTNGAFAVQGVNHNIFRPIPEHQSNHGRFTIGNFAKAEFRKSTDVYIKVFAEFQKRHSDVWLSLGWYNNWPVLVDTLRVSPHIRYVDGATVMETLRKTCEANGIDMDRTMLHPSIGHQYMADLHRECDIEVYVGRAESGNLPAMEAMACGVPLVAMCETGMSDILFPGAYFSVSSVVSDWDKSPQYEGWREPFYEDLLGQMELAYGNREQRVEIGENGRKWLKRFTWEAMATTIRNAVVKRLTARAA